MIRKTTLAEANLLSKTNQPSQDLPLVPWSKSWWGIFSVHSLKNHLFFSFFWLFFVIASQQREARWLHWFTLHDVCGDFEKSTKNAVDIVQTRSFQTCEGRKWTKKIEKKKRKKVLRGTKSSESDSDKEPCLPRWVGTYPLGGGGGGQGGQSLSQASLQPTVS